MSKLIITAEEWRLERRQFSWGKPKEVKVRKKPRQEELELQQRCVAWFNEEYPEYEGLLWGSMNAGKRTPRQGAALKAAGMQEGVPDLSLQVPKKQFAGLMVELKVGNRQPSEAQVVMLARLRGQGYKAVVKRTLEEFQEVVRLYMALPPFRSGPTF